MRKMTARLGLVFLAVAMLSSCDRNTKALDTGEGDRLVEDTGACAEEIFCQDYDGDKYWNTAECVCQDAAPAGFISEEEKLGRDCKDHDSNINPGATEVCGDDVDNDCDDLIDSEDPNADGFDNNIDTDGNGICDDIDHCAGPMAIQECTDLVDPFGGDEPTRIPTR